MTASEKYAEVGESRPVCKCHGRDMSWNKDGRRASGGFWICAIKTSLRAVAWGRSNPDKQRKHSLEFRRRQLGWYDEGGMATKPLQAKELI